jgi:hypothetical protein
LDRTSYSPGSESHLGHLAHNSRLAGKTVYRVTCCASELAPVAPVSFELPAVQLSQFHDGDPEKPAYDLKKAARNKKVMERVARIVPLAPVDEVRN